MTKARLARSGALLGSAAVAALAWQGVALAQSNQTAPPPPPGTGSTAGQSATPNAGGPSSGPLSEVVVTAQRRSENLQRVPISVTSFSGQALASEQVGSTLDLAREVPNMFASNNVGQGSANEYYLRGLGQTQSFPTFEPQVGTYIDDIYIARQNANNFALFGVDQVQVLNGPQGTLFGRNSTGGAILVSLTKPKDQFGGDAQLSYGRFNAFTGRASVDLPINDQVLTRTSVYGISEDGYVEDVTTHQKLNGTHDWGVREAVRLLPKQISNFTWDLAVDYERNDSANLLNYPTNSGGVDGDGRISVSGFSTSPGALEPFFTGHKATLGQGALVQSWGFASHMTYKADAGTLDFITGFRGLQQDLAADFPLGVPGPASIFDSFPTGSFVIGQGLRSSQYSQEIKWNSSIGDRFTYTAGAFYLYETNSNNFGELGNLSLFVPSLIPLVGLDYPARLVDEFTKNQTISEAVYAQGDYKLTDKLTLTVGARYTHEIKSVLARPNAPGSGFSTADVLAAGYKTHLDADEVTPRFALQYQATPQVMLFASATRGFQGGGWNGLSSAAADFNNFGPETIWSYETGFRSQTPDNRLRFNATLFYENVNSYQLLYDNPITGNFDTNNAANLSAYGVEGTVVWRPVDDLTLNLNFGGIDATYFKPAAFVVAQQQSCQAGTASACDNGIVRPNGTLAKPVFTPPVQAAFTASYNFRFSPVVITPTFSVQYFARQVIDTAETPFVGEDPSHAMIDFSLLFAPRNHPFTFTVECKNCTSTAYKTTYLLGSDYWNPPGIWDVSVHYKF